MSNRSIALDVRMWDHPGIGRYIRELVQQPSYSSFENGIYFLGYRKFKDQILNGASENRFREAPSKIYSLNEQWDIPRKAGDAGLLHVPHFNVPILFQKKLVVTVHDLIYVRDKEAMPSLLGKTYVSFLLKHIQKKAAAVITVSENTKKNLLEFLPNMSPDRIFVTHEAASTIFKKIDNREKLEETLPSYKRIVLIQSINP